MPDTARQSFAIKPPSLEQEWPRGFGRSLEIESWCWRRIGAILALLVAITAAHYLTPDSHVLAHAILQHSFYAPIILGAVYFGWRGGLLVAACVTMCYIPHIVSWAAVDANYTLNQYSELGGFFLVGAVTGALADRERRRTRELQRTTEELSGVYHDLQDSFEQVKKADRLSAVGQLAAGLAHEIRNPLASIEGAINVLEQKDNPEAINIEFREIVKKECVRLKSLLTDLLDFARPRQPQYRSVDVAEPIRAVANLAGHAARQANIALRTDIPADLPLLRCDPEQIQQVLLNMTINAIQATSQGGEIVISARKSESTVDISVKDQGMGIPPELLDKVFDPFFTTKEHGTGLGLSVAYQIIDQHGGRILAARNPDRGMTFSVVLPLVSEEGNETL